MAPTHAVPGLLLVQVAKLEPMSKARRHRSRTLYYHNFETSEKNINVQIIYETLSYANFEQRYRS